MTEAEIVAAQEEPAVTEPEEVAPVSEEEPESEPVVEDGEPKRKPTAQERIQELANARREAEERAARIEAELQTVKETAASLERQFREKQESKPDYIEIDERVMSQVNQRLAELDEIATNAKLSGDYLRGIAAQREIDSIYQGLQENTARMEKARAIQAEQQKQGQTVQALNDRAEFYRQANNIPEEVWREGGNWFAAQCDKDPILGKEFVELAQYAGPMSAIRFAADYTARNMPKPEAAKQQKEDAKAKLPGGTGATTVKTSQELTDDLPQDEWYRIRREQKQKRR